MQKFVAFSNGLFSIYAGLVLFIQPEIVHSLLALEVNDSSRLFARLVGVFSIVIGWIFFHAYGDSKLFDALVVKVFFGKLCAVSVLGSYLILNKQVFDGWILVLFEALLAIFLMYCFLRRVSD